MTEPKTPLAAYGPDGEVVAYSYDGGATWSAVPAAPPAPPARQFTRRIAALADPLDPWCARRILPVLSELYRVGIFAGWGPLPDVLATAADLDAIVLPLSLTTPAVLKQMHRELSKRARPRLILDVPTPIADPVALSLLHEALKHVDAVLVPTDLVAMELRRHHPTVFTVPPVLLAPLPPLPKRDVSGPIRIAIQETTAPGVATALAAIKERYGEGVELVDDAWLPRHPLDAERFYAEIDLLVAGPPPQPTQASAAPLLPALARGCLPIVDRVYGRTIRDGVNGKVVPKADPTAWRRVLVSVIEDRRLRRHLMQGAYRAAQRATASAQIAQLARPFRVLLPERAPFTVVPGDRVSTASTPA